MKAFEHQDIPGHDDIFFSGKVESGIQGGDFSGVQL
jgi:hypothetical protein